MGKGGREEGLCRRDGGHAPPGGCGGTATSAPEPCRWSSAHQVSQGAAFRGKRGAHAGGDIQAGGLDIPARCSFGQQPMRESALMEVAGQTGDGGTGVQRGNSIRLGVLIPTIGRVTADARRQAPRAGGARCQLLNECGLGVAVEPVDIERLRLQPDIVAKV